MTFYGSQITIGVDTALNIALEAIDRLKITASSHHRAFLVEVMGRNCGYLALMTAIAGGAEAVSIPESEMGPEDLAEEIRTAYERGKAHAIVVVAEGCSHNPQSLANHFAEYHERLGFDLRLTILGHVQRGGAPGAFDRFARDSPPGPQPIVNSRSSGSLTGKARVRSAKPPRLGIVA